MRFAIHVTPRSRSEGVEVDARARVVRVRVTAAPESGRANEAAVALLRRKLGLKAGALRIVGGATQRRKWIEAEGIEETELWRKLEAGS